MHCTTVNGPNKDERDETGFLGVQRMCPVTVPGPGGPCLCGTCLLSEGGNAESVRIHGGMAVPNGQARWPPSKYSSCGCTN